MGKVIIFKIPSGRKTLEDSKSLEAGFNKNIGVCHTVETWWDGLLKASCFFAKRGLNHENSGIHFRLVDNRIQERVARSRMLSKTEGGACRRRQSWNRCIPTCESMWVSNDLKVACHFATLIRQLYKQHSFLPCPSHLSLYTTKALWKVDTPLYSACIGA